ncbi:hypothetical protein FA15DRAFT_301536 [Coprinopsis marcescibilis]|uniref:Uncharacterized protein n=1 Tax=Coprinopsis marcescibilis TaxID=230819 RepID=A0A5C3KCY8_COPMA|nr:hypothetical protein FA15DRAFT_301536 [Coprinopsis marcescibilis]
MMPLSVADDYTIQDPLRLSACYQRLFASSILNAVIILGFSLSQLGGKGSFYTSPIAALLTIIHSSTLWILCRRESQRDPSYSARRRKMATTRRISVASTFALELLWVAAFVILVIFITAPHQGSNFGVSRILGLVEAVLTGIQACLTMWLAVRCTRERISTRRVERTSQHRSGRWFWIS